MLGGLNIEKNKTAAEYIAHCRQAGLAK